MQFLLCKDTIFPLNVEINSCKKYYLWNLWHAKSHSPCGLWLSYVSQLWL